MREIDSDGSLRRPAAIVKAVTSSTDGRGMARFWLPPSVFASVCTQTGPQDRTLTSRATVGPPSRYFRKYNTVCIMFTFSYTKPRYAQLFLSREETKSSIM